MTEYGDNTMVRTQISIDRDLYDEARLHAKKLGVSVAELCRRGLRGIVAGERESRPWMKYVGCVSSGDADASSSVDDVVYNRPEP